MADYELHVPYIKYQTSQMKSYVWVKGKCKGRLGGYDGICNPVLFWSLKIEAIKILSNTKN